MADWATQSTYAHETGHSLGLPHSSGPYGQTYDSRWDVMSGGNSYDKTVQTRVAPHTIAFHKDLLGWIPASRKYVAPRGTTSTFELARDAIPGATGYEMAQIPVPGGAEFYTVEARLFAGYDARGRLPGEAVVIHRVNPADVAPAKVVDADGNGDPNDAGAMWTPGETFQDLQAGVRVRVLARTATGFLVQVSTAGPVMVSGDSLLAGGTMGAPYSAQLAASGTAGATAWSVTSGRLPQGLSLSDDGEVTGVPTEAGTFRFTVAAVSASGFGVRQVRVDVAEPKLASAQVMDQLLLGSGGLTAEQVRYLDLLGNRNGRLDVGDVRAWLEDQDLPVGGAR
jgi:hypothetical protein